MGKRGCEKGWRKHGYVPRAGERKLVDKDIEGILALCKKRIFEEGEIATMKKISRHTVASLANRNLPPKECYTKIEHKRISVTLNDHWSLVLRKLLWKIEQEGKLFTPKEIIESAIDLLSFAYGISTRRRAPDKSRGVPRTPIPSRIYLLRFLAKHKGKIPSSKTSKVFSNNKHTFLHNVCLYYGIDPLFVRKHYDAEGKYWTIRRLKELSQKPGPERAKALCVSFGQDRRFFAAHGIEPRQMRTRFLHTKKEEKERKRT